jgi:hypothetical protein
MYGLWLPLWYLLSFGHCSLSFDVRIMFTPLVSSFEDTKGVIIIRTSKRDRLQWSTGWRYQMGNHNPYIEEAHVLRCMDSDYAFDILKHLAIVACASSMYGLWLPIWYLQPVDHCSLSLFASKDRLQCQNIEDTKGVIIIRTSMRDRLQWPKVWIYQRGNHSPYSEGQTFWLSLLYLQTVGYCSMSFDVWILIMPLISSNCLPL